MIAKLIDIISKEAALFESFLELLERQKQMLVANNVEGLTEVTALQQEKLSESRALSRRREQILNQIKLDHTLGSDVTISRLVALADESQAARLMQLRRVILSLNEKINDARNTNAMLLNQSRDFVAKTMALLARMSNPESNYTGARQTSQGTSTLMLDRRA
jgi:flagellar biosynthesis/type III secretory pathway chaperone